MNVRCDYVQRKSVFRTRRAWYGRGQKPKWRLVPGSVHNGWKVTAVGHEGFTPVVHFEWVG